MGDKIEMEVALRFLSACKKLQLYIPFSGRLESFEFAKGFNRRPSLCLCHEGDQAAVDVASAQADCRISHRKPESWRGTLAVVRSIIERFNACDSIGSSGVP